LLGLTACSSDGQRQTLNESNTSARYVHGIGISSTERVVGFPLFGTIAINKFSVADEAFDNQRIRYYEIKDAALASVPLKDPSVLPDYARIFDTNHYWETESLSEMLADTAVHFLRRVKAADKITQAEYVSRKPEYILDAKLNKFYIVGISRNDLNMDESSDVTDNNALDSGLISHRMQNRYSSYEDQVENSKLDIYSPAKQYNVLIEIEIKVTETANNSVMLANTYYEEIMISDGDLNDAVEAVSDALSKLYQHFATDLMGRLS
jgi:hypothetical protein